MQTLGPVLLVVRSMRPSTQMTLKATTSASNNITTIACTTYAMSLCEGHVFSTWLLVVALSENVLLSQLLAAHGWLPEDTPAY